MGRRGEGDMEVGWVVGGGRMIGESMVDHSGGYPTESHSQRREERD